jgi:hypothetical protein
MCPTIQSVKQPRIREGGTVMTRDDIGGIMTALDGLREDNKDHRIQFRYIAGRLDENAEAHLVLHKELGAVREDVVKNSVITSLDNKSKGLVAGTSGFISAIIAGLAMYFGGGGQ